MGLTFMCTSRFPHTHAHQKRTLCKVPACHDREVAGAGCCRQRWQPGVSVGGRCLGSVGQTDQSCQPFRQRGGVDGHDARVSCQRNTTRSRTMHSHATRRNAIPAACTDRLTVCFGQRCGDDLQRLHCKKKRYTGWRLDGQSTPYNHTLNPDASAACATGHFRPV